MNIVRILLGLLLLLGAAAVVVWLAISVGTWFFALPPETLAPVAGVTGLLLVPVITYFTTRALERRRSLETAIREHKTKLYDETIRGLMRMLNLGGEKKFSEEEIKRLFADVTPPLITYGSRGVILAWNKFRSSARTDGVTPWDTLLAFENLLKAMRKDLGHRVVSHQPGELLAIFVNDVDEALSKARKAK